MRSIRCVLYFKIIILGMGLCLWGNLTLDGQSFGGLPASVKWSQIDTDTCRIIFPTHLESQAKRIAEVIHNMRRYHTEEIGDQAFKIDIVLNNQSTISNGSVSLAPWKSHFLTTPSPHSFQLSALPWLDLLTAHEYRHVIQRSTARRGISNVLYYLFGEETWAGATSLSIPNWFYEGDAVWAETSLSSQGRGRIPEFMKGYRALAHDDLQYSYNKARNGSIKDYVPDHYRLGYLMMQYGHENYGGTLWKNVLEEAGAYKGLFYPFSNSLKDKTGYSTRSMYESMLDENASRWQNLWREMDAAPVRIPSNEPGVYTDFLYPKLGDEGQIVYYSQSFEKTGAFYQLDQGGTTSKLVDQGLASSNYFGYLNGRLAWTELTTDPRWVAEDFTDIILFENGDRRRITKKGKYFSPQPNRDGTHIVAVWQGDDLNNRIHIINVETGVADKILKNPDNYVFNYPQWNPESDEIITAVRQVDGQMGIIAIHLQTDRTRIVVPFQNSLIGAIQVSEGKVCYSAYTPQSEQIFLTDLQTGQTLQISNEPNGAYHGFCHNGAVFYTTFTSMGHRIKSLTVNPTKPDTDPIHLPSMSYTRNIFEEVTPQNYEVKRYREIGRIFNVHTWGFDFDDPTISLRALSTNVLNNVETAAGVNFNYDTQLFSPFARMTIATFFPIINLQASTTQRTGMVEDEALKWRETSVFGGLSLDLNLTSGKYRRTLSPIVAYNQIFLGGDLDFSIPSALAQITYVQKRIQASKNLFTRNGQYLQFRWSESLNDLSARQLSLRTGLSLPGIGINHNLILLADYKGDLEDGDYRFSSGLNQRGLGLIDADKIWRLSGNYHVPIFYPDWGFGGLVYFYRIRANVWYEYSSAHLEGNLSRYHSVGVELVFDVNLFNETATSIGVRSAFAIDTKQTGPRFEVFIPVYRF